MASQSIPFKNMHMPAFNAAEAAIILIKLDKTDTEHELVGSWAIFPNNVTFLVFIRHKK
jgi:hypothetical protein